MDITPDQQRKMLSISFAPHGDGYLYYRNSWSRGVPVSAAEREAYISMPLTTSTFGSRRAWRQSIAGREAIGRRRPYGPAELKLLAAMPSGFAVIFLLGAATGIAGAIHATTQLSLVGNGVFAGTMLLLGVAVAFAKLTSRRAS